MSRSKPALSNPCSKFIDYHGDEGVFTYYDKESKKKVEIPLPIYFTTLDELNTISGFNEKFECGIYSNEVHFTTSEVLRVKTLKGGISITGLYKDIRDNIVAIGGKFAKSVYALMINPDKTTEFVNFKFKGAAFSAWLDKKFNPLTCIVGIVDFVEEKKGKNTYLVPVFKQFKLTDEIDAEALQYDEILQAYLKEYKAQIPEKEIAQAEAANPLTDPIPPLANKEGVWQGGSKSKLPPTKQELVNEAKKAMEAGKTGKQYTRSMSNIEDLPQGHDDNMDMPPENDELSDLPFILTIPIAIGLLAPFFM
jgi:hypothetical protein